MPNLDALCLGDEKASMGGWQEVGLRVVGRWVVRIIVAVAVLLGLLLGLWTVLPPVSTLMLGRWATGRSVERDWVPLERISPNLRTAVIMSEDGQFCRHAGVDWQALGTVLDAANGPNRGASTIPMQVVKNLFLWPSRSVVRKGIEIPMALLIDLLWSKRRILEVYLNIAEWGEGVFGAEAAARSSFGRSAASLTPTQAALLVTALPNPRLRRPEKPTRRQAALARIVLLRMARGGEAAACVLPERD